MNKLKSLLATVVVTMAGLALPQFGVAAPLTLESGGQTNGLLIFTWTNTAGQTYLLQYKTNLNQGNWDILTGAIITTNARVPASDRIASLGAGRFYRVLILTTNVSDTTKPTLAISTPTSGQSVSNATFLIQGTAADNKQVAAVAYQINSNNWAGAFTVNKWTNWSAPVGLIPGTNSLKAYAVDTNANISTTNSVSFVYVVSAILVVNTNGFGSVNPNYNRALLQLGRGYSMTATGTNGHKFDHWELSINWLNPVVTTNAKLSFVMQSNLTLQVFFADTNRPTVTISSPTSGQAVSNAFINATGTAQDNAGVAAVWCNVNGRGWRLAGTTNSWSNWVARVALNRQTNTLSVYAVDTSGNRSTTNSVSFTLKTNQILETVTQTITAVGGGSITLPSGSRFSIPGGMLSNDMSVTLSIVSTLSQQPPSGLIIGVGPTLVVSFTPLTNSLAKLSSPHPMSPGPVSSQPEVSLIYGGEDIVGVAGSESMVDAVDLSGTHQFIGIPGQSANSGTTFYPSPVLFDNSRTLQFSLGNLKPAVELAPLPTAGSRIWNGTSWVVGLPGFDPNKKTLILVHGMLSCVENAFGDAAALNAMMAAGGYQQVVGFDYDWTQGIDTSGQQLAGFMQTLHSAGLQSADLESHSEGVPVSLSAICRDSSLKINNMVMLGGPIMGTPAAAIGAGVQLAGGILELVPLVTALANVPFAQALPTGMMPSGMTLDDLIKAQFAIDLSPSSPVLANNRECVANKMADTGSSLASTKMVTVCGDKPAAFIQALTNQFGSLGKVMNILYPDGFDSIIGTSSASGIGAGFDPNRTTHLGCYPLSHTQLEGDRTVINDVALHLTGAPAPYALTISTAAGTGSGTVGVNPVGPYARGLGTKVTLTAVADSGSTFTGWSGDASGTVNPTTVLMTTNRSVTATFTKNRILTINPPGGTGSGTVTANPPGLNPLLTYTNGTIVTLTATPDTGSTFTGWGGDLSGAANSIQITMNGNKSVTATFSTTNSTSDSVAFRITSAVCSLESVVGCCGGIVAYTYKIIASGTAKGPLSSWMQVSAWLEEEQTGYTPDIISVPSWSHEEGYSSFFRGAGQPAETTWTASWEYVTTVFDGSAPTPTPYLIEGSAAGYLPSGLSMAEDSMAVTCQ